MKTPKQEREENFFYENIRTLRLMIRYTQRYVADSIGVSQVYYSKMELGEKTISLANALRISRLFKISLDTLINSDLMSASDTAFKRL